MPPSIKPIRSSSEAHTRARRIFARLTARFWRRDRPKRLIQRRLRIARNGIGLKPLKGNETAKRLIRRRQ